jgi:hypothetical protein
MKSSGNAERCRDVVSGAGVQQAKSLAKGSLAAPQLCRLWGRELWSLVLLLLVALPLALRAW